MGYVIADLTRDCPRDDCLIQQCGASMTLLGWTPTYNKLGELQGRGDPNTMTEGYVCGRCGVRWQVKTQYGESKIERFDPKPAQQETARADQSR